MIQNCSEARALTSLLASPNQRSSQQKARAAAYIEDVIESASSKFSTVGQADLIERTFKAAAGFLEEGSLDTRTHGKRILWAIKLWQNSQSSFMRLVEQLPQESQRKKVLEVVQGTNGPPPPLHRTVNRIQVGSLGTAART